MSSRPSLLSQNSASRRREPSFPSLQTSKSNSNTSTNSVMGAWGSAAPSAAADPPSFSSAVNRSSKTPSLSLSGFNSSSHKSNQSTKNISTKNETNKNLKSIHPLKFTWSVSFSHRSAIDGRPGRKKEEISTRGGGGGGGSKGETSEDWRGGLVNLGEFASIESLFPFLSHLTPSSALPASQNSTANLFQTANSTEISAHSTNFVSDLNVFRSPILPAWEDLKNVGGGRWVLRMRKGVADRIWEEIVWALVGERIGATRSQGEIAADDAGEDTASVLVNGIVLSVRKEEDILSIWCAQANRADRDLIRDSVKLALADLLSPTALANLQIDYKPHPVAQNHHSANHSHAERGNAGENSTTSRSNHAPNSHNSRTERTHSHHQRTGDRNGEHEHRNQRERSGEERTGAGERERSLRSGSGFSSYVSRRTTEAEGKERNAEGAEISNSSRGFGRTRRTSLSKGEHQPPIIANTRWAA